MAVCTSLQRNGPYSQVYDDPLPRSDKYVNSIVETTEGKLKRERHSRRSQARNFAAKSGNEIKKCCSIG